MTRSEILYYCGAIEIAFICHRPTRRTILSRHNSAKRYVFENVMMSNPTSCSALLSAGPDPSCPADNITTRHGNANRSRFSHTPRRSIKEGPRATYGPFATDSRVPRGQIMRFSAAFALVRTPARGHCSLRRCRCLLPPRDGLLRSQRVNCESSVAARPPGGASRR